MPKPEALAEKYPDGALVIGTRRILSLCDELSPAVVGWIDADAGEKRVREYDAKARLRDAVGIDVAGRRSREKDRRPKPQAGTGGGTHCGAAWRVFTARTERAPRMGTAALYADDKDIYARRHGGRSFL